MMGWVGAVGWAGWIVTAGCVLAFWAVVIYLMATMFRTERGSARPADSDPMRLLESRFARGDIDADEFVASRKVLATPGPAGLPAPLSAPSPSPSPRPGYGPRPHKPATR